MKLRAISDYFSFKILTKCSVNAFLKVPIRREIRLKNVYSHHCHLSSHYLHVNESSYISFIFSTSEQEIRAKRNRKTKLYGFGSSLVTLKLTFSHQYSIHSEASQQNNERLRQYFFNRTKLL